ncbi:hypothetical protein LTR56_023096 [Elasticomyces elasticus]|nr:hypothetical protein LTR56_023096 [Elasticomyces elasticus]KAK3639665.1 hypothetical protein LTR22_017338 [Elasticomyces elasticus]KAK4913443.1 hypothetical protein LTR49_018239 [Elasticomyces elasticus]KAK5760986.1 hypothetical protein LTS12_008834 [Elasticomyces elasticus]
MPKKKRQGSGAVTASKRTLRSQTKSRLADIKEQKSAFLALPAELRNTIYELALLQSDDIEVDDQLRPPPLLQVSRQVREETGSMWYERNVFFQRVMDCDARLVSTWSRYCRNIGMSGEVQIVISGVPNWSNLLEWCRELVEGHSGYPFPDENDDNMESMILSAHKIALDFNRDHRPWKDCKMVLEVLRRAVGRYDSRWLN